MICLPCNKKYFSTVLQEKEDGNLFPATWEKYHCGTMINELMKCVKCHHNLNLDIKTKKLVCQNKSCNFISKPESILWKCFICSKDFRSKAKVYNPLEFQILKKAINFSLLLKKKAAPKELPCGCEKDISKLTFYHKEKCRGELYQGILIDKEIIVCSKCHSINFEEKYNWICPICSSKFHLHSILGCKPFSKKKYVINKRYNKSAKNIPAKKHNKEYKEKSLNNINLYNKKETEIERLAKDLNPKNSKKPITVDLKDPGLKNPDTFFETNTNENNKKIISLKKPRHLTSTYERKKKHYSTLIEILQKRKQNNLRNSTNDIRIDKNKKDNKNQELNKTMVVSQSMNDNLFSKRKDNRYYKYKAFAANKNSEKEKLDNNNKDKKYNDKTYIKKNNDTYIKVNTNENHFEQNYFNKSEKSMKFRTRLHYKIPSFNAEETLKNNNNNNNKTKEIIRNAESTDFSSYKTLSSNSNIRYNSNLFNTLTSVNNSNRFKNPLNSFRYRNKKSNTNSSDSKVLDTLRFSKLNEHENSYQDMFTDLPPLSKNIEADNSSLRLSLIEGNNKLNDVHDYSYKKNINSDKNQKMEEIEEPHNLNYKSPRNKQRKTINYDNIYNDIYKDDEDNNNNREINIKKDEDDNKEEETVGKIEDDDETKGKLEEDEAIEKAGEDEAKGRLDNNEKNENINDEKNKVKIEKDNNTKGKLVEDDIKSNLNDEDQFSNDDDKLIRKETKGIIEVDNKPDDDDDNSVKLEKKETKGKIELDESNSKDDDDNSSQKYEDNTIGKLVEDKDDRKNTFEEEETNGKFDNSDSEEDKIEENKKIKNKNEFKIQKIRENNEDENEEESSDNNKKVENNENMKVKEDKDNNEENENSESSESSVSSETNKKKQSEDSKKKDESESQKSESIDEEDEDKFDTIPYPTNIKKNARESFVLNSDIIFQSVLISQDKLNSLASKINIPTIDENDYEYIKSIGEGTYGIVYLVQNRTTLEQFALKKIVCRDYNELIKHKNELELNYSIKHKHILSLCGLQFKYLDETTSSIYVLMELAQNDWSKEIKRRMLAKKYYKEFEIVAILKQIIQGFLFLQEKNISHRDVKPQNILLFPNNVYKIADFGEAKNIKNIAQQNTLRGSQLYMSPVLYKGYKFNKKNVLHNPYKSDVFSLGYCLLYAICLNLKVLESLRELTTMRSIKSCVNKYLVNHQYSDKLMDIIYKMIEPNEDQRLDFEDLLEELDKNF